MGKPKGSIGETKLKILAILHNNEASGISSYGYGIWTTITKRFYSCLGEDGLRNVYHHLEDLYDMGLIKRSALKTIKGAPKRRIYRLTKKGRRLREKFEKYLEPLQISN